MKLLRKALLVTLMAALRLPAAAQDVDILFLGNSYTQVNNLPSAIVNLAVHNGHTIYVESSTPGGCTLGMHSRSEASLQKIRKGRWDFVVLQEQSQMPSINHYRYSDMYPATERLRDSILKYNPCAEIILYMTWGRKNGGQQCEDYGEGTYCSADFANFDHMQDTMTSAYSQLAKEMECLCAPVGEAWRNAIHATSFNMFSSDGSHPSIYGTYLAACTFYESIWKESPVGAATAYTLTEEEAATLQEIAHSTHNGASTWDFSRETKAAFDVEQVNWNTIRCINASESPFHDMQCLWDFGDGSTSEDTEPLHAYQHPGEYEIKLTVTSCRHTDTASRSVALDFIYSVEEHAGATRLHPNPTSETLLSDKPFSGTIVVKSLTGQTLSQREAHGETQFDMSMYSPGVYLVTLIHDGITENFKLVKE